jgi:uncharacterized protein YlxW (UPF0749 family)
MSRSGNPLFLLFPTLFLRRTGSSAGGRNDLELLQALKMNVPVKIVRDGVCIGQRTISIDGTTEVRHVTQALARLQLGTCHVEDKTLADLESERRRLESEARELEARKRRLEEKINELKCKSSSNVVVL